MPLQIPEGFALIEFQFSIPTPGGQKIAYSTCGSGGTETMTLLELAQSWHTHVWTEHLLGDTSENVTLMRVTALTETSSGEDNVFDAGGRSGATSPPNVSSLIQKRSASRGRENHGRFYWPGLLNDTEVADDGTIEGTRYSNLSASWNLIFDALVEDDIQPVILHNSASVPTPITAFNYSPVIATQRRRLKRP